MTVDVNLVAVILAALSSFLVGGIWYSRVLFGKSWMGMVGMTDKKAQTGTAKAMGWSLVAALLTAYVLACVTTISHDFYNNSFLKDALNTAFWLWLGVSASTIVVHDAFEQRDMKLTAINAGNQLATFMVMGLIIGLMS